MLLRKFDQSIQLLTNVFMFSALHQLQTQIVERVHQDAVLIIHGLYADDAPVIPGKEGHKTSTNSSPVYRFGEGIQMTLTGGRYGTLDPSWRCAHSRITSGCGSWPRVVRTMAAPR